MKKSCCGCCAGIEIVTPASEYNRPGLSAIQFRVGTHAAFLESMLACISSLSLQVPATPGSSDLVSVNPLRALTTRDPSDPAIAFMDAWATVADVLTFYQERIANEGYLRTALEQRSLLELAKLVGYRLRPGVSASVYLAFTVASGFSGVVPAGTRAQSIPGPGEKPQFFETSDDLPARDVWNALTPRTARPQLITFADDPTVNQTEGTDAATRGTLYFAGTSTNLNAGDSVLIVANDNPDLAQLRRVAAIDAQTAFERTEVVLDPSPLVAGQNIVDTATEAFQPYIDEAASIFPDVDLASEVASLLTTLLANIKASPQTAGAQAFAIQPQVESWHDTADRRHFTRLEPWLADLLRTVVSFEQLAANSLTHNEHATAAPQARLASLESNRPDSPIASLSKILAPLDQPPSLQPANSLRLNRSVQQTFSRQADLAPRLLATMHPRIGTALYQAWSGIQSPAPVVSVSAIRARASLFAAGSNGLPTYDGNNKLTGFSDVSISTTWDTLASGTNPLPIIALDGAFDKIQVGSWTAITRPNLSSGGAITTYHQVTAVRTVTMAAAPPPAAAPGEAPADTTTSNGPTGYTAKSTQLTLAPPWLSDASASVSDLLGSPDVLRGTVVYAQAEQLDLADEPLDSQVEGNTLELDSLYDGLDSGRWIIVSGERTDIPDTTGVTASELVMISAVAQGSRSLLSVDFPAGIVPFAQISYTTDANFAGDRLVVGTLASGFSLQSIPLPTGTNQQYSDQVELAAGFYASAYVPTAAERQGDFSDFAGLLVDPDTNLPFPGGRIPDTRLSTLFAWRTSTQPVHTILTLANSLAYTYDPATVTIYGNVVKATNGQSQGEVLGNGDSSQEFQTFQLHQSPLTWLSAPTPFGAADTLTVRVNEIAWTEADNLAGAGPRDRDYITETDDAGTTSVIFGTGQHGARVPTGSGNVKAAYRGGTGSAGNVAALQISQLATMPLGVKSVINPLPSSGGADGDTVDQARRNIPIALLALDRLVSIEDYAAFARAYAGIAKASSVRISDGFRLVLHLTIAGNGDIPIDPNSDLYRNLSQALVQYGDPGEPLQLALRSSKLLVISAGIRILPQYAWETVVAAARSALLSYFSFEARDLGQSAFSSEAISVIQGVEGVQYVNLTVFDAVADNITPAQLASLGSSLRLHGVVEARLARIDPAQTDPALRILPAQLVTLSPDIADTLILTEITA